MSEIEDVFKVAEGLARSGLYKGWTPYLVMGDEPLPPDHADTGRVYTGVVDLASQMKPDQLRSIKELFKLMPRQYLRAWFNETIRPTLSWDAKNNEYQFETMLWGAFIELFNQANREYVDENRTTPWMWEHKKLSAMLQANAKSEVAALEERFNRLALRDPQAERITAEYAALPKLGDEGLEINRQNAVRELLRMKEYDAAQSIVDAYRLAGENPQIAEILSKPLPYTVTGGM